MTAEPTGPTTPEERAAWREEPHVFNLVWEKRARRMMAQIDALEAALEPFAAFAEEVTREHPGWDHDQFDFAYPFPKTFMRDLRRVRTARKLADAMMGEKKKHG